MNGLILGLALLLLLANVLVTAALLRSELFEKRQKRLQALFIWLIPFVGALLAWSVMREERNALHTTNLANYAGEGAATDCSPGGDSGCGGEGGGD